MMMLEAAARQGGRGPAGMTPVSVNVAAAVAAWQRRRRGSDDCEEVRVLYPKLGRGSLALRPHTGQD